MKIKLFGAMAASTALLLAAAAQAQEAAPAPASADEKDVVVLSPFEVRSVDKGYAASNSITASRFALPIIDTPMSITVVTEEFLRDIGARDALDSLSYVSGVTQMNAPIRLEGSNSFNIRGVTSSFILRNGVTSYGINDGYNIERWEVLKGIVGMMYGDRNLGGVINSVSAQPREKAGGEIYVRTDEYNSYRVSGRITGPLNKDRSLLFVVSALKKDEGTYMRDERLRAQGVTAGLTWRPFDQTKISVEYELYSQKNVLGTKLPPFQLAAGPRFDNDTNWWQRVGFAPVPLDFNYGGTDSYLNEINRAINGTFDQRLTSWLDFRSNAVYSKRAQNRLNRDAGPTYTTVAPGRARNYFDWATGTFKTETNADAPYVINSMNSNLRENRNWNFLWRSDLLANYDFLGARHRTMIGYEVQERSGDFKAFDSLGAVTLDARNPYAAAIRAVDSRGRVNTDIRTFNPALPRTTREEFYARVASDPNDQFGNFNGSTNLTKAYYFVHYSQFWKDRLTVFGGVRRDLDRNKENFQRLDSVLRRPNGQPRNSPYGTKVYGNTTDWRGRNSPQVGLSFRVLPEVSVYATWSDVLVALNGADRTYIDQITNSNGTYTVGTHVDQPSQTGQNKEIGIKTELFEGRLSTTLAFFKTELQNKPFEIRRDDPSNITMPANAPVGTLAPLAYWTLSGLERYQGVEFDVVYNITKDLRIVGSYAYTDAGVVKDNGVRTDATSPTGATPPQTVKRSEGFQAAMVPKNQWRLWTHYRFPQSEGVFRTASVGVGVRYYGPALPNTDIYRSTTVLDTTVVDVSVSRKFRIFDRDFNTTLRVQNLFDTRYYATTQLYGDPRAVALEVRHNF